MDSCKHLKLTFGENKETLYKYNINNEENPHFLSMKESFEKLHKGKFFLMNGECSFRYNYDDLSKCPRFEQ